MLRQVLCHLNDVSVVGNCAQSETRNGGPRPDFVTLTWLQVPKIGTRLSRHVLKRLTLISRWSYRRGVSTRVASAFFSTSA